MPLHHPNMHEINGLCEIVEIIGYAILSKRHPFKRITKLRSVQSHKKLVQVYELEKFS